MHTEISWKLPCLPGITSRSLQDVHIRGFKVFMKRSIPLHARKFLVLAILSALIVFSCAQDSIFFYVTNELEPKDPIIPGSPTNMVIVDNKVYVGTFQGREVWVYDDTSGGEKWSRIKRPGGSIGGLAVANDGIEDFLYALVFPNREPLETSAIKKYDSVLEDWTDTYEAPPGYSIQSVFGAGGKIFAGAQLKSNYQSYAVLFLDPEAVSPSLDIVKTETSFLRGAAAAGPGGDIYLATNGSGILKFDIAALPDPISQTAVVSGNIAGIIETGGIITAVSSGGTVYYYDPAAEMLYEYYSTSFNFTGAICIWKQYDPDIPLPADKWKPSLLLLGVYGERSSTTHGYREILLNEEAKPTGVLRKTGNDIPSSVKMENEAKYNANLGTHPVEHIIQIPEGVMDYPDMEMAENEGWEPLMFASTSREGLWSYRDGVWNAEE